MRNKGTRTHCSLALEMIQLSHVHNEAFDCIPIQHARYLGLKMKVGVVGRAPRAEVARAQHHPEHLGDCGVHAASFRAG